MAGLSITGQLKVSTLQDNFLKEFGLTLRVYDGRSFADPSQTLAQARKHKGSGNGLSVAKNMKVGSLERKFEVEFGLKVQVAGSDDSYLCNDDFTLNAAQLEDEKKLSRKTKKALRQEDEDSAVDGDDTSSSSESSGEDADEVEASVNLYMANICGFDSEAEDFEEDLSLGICMFFEALEMRLEETPDAYLVAAENEDDYDRGFKNTGLIKITEKGKELEEESVSELVKKSISEFTVFDGWTQGVWIFFLTDEIQDDLEPGEIWDYNFQRIADWMEERNVILIGYHGTYEDIAYQAWDEGQWDEGVESSSDSEEREFYLGDKMLDINRIPRDAFDFTSHKIIDVS